MGTSGAVATTFAVRGVRRPVSQMMRTGFLPSSMRQVSIGSSVSTVPTPTMIAVRRFLCRCTCARASSPVTQREAPVWAAILPSMVMAYFMTTKGRFVFM